MDTEERKLLEAIAMWRLFRADSYWRSQFIYACAVYSMHLNKVLELKTETLV